MKSGVPAAEWLVIAKQMEMTKETLAGIFLQAWKDTHTNPSWKKLSKALSGISDAADQYKGAIKQAETNAGTYILYHHVYGCPRWINMCYINA